MPDLPPLNALKSFEAAARLGGFSAAATELRVTPAAVSQQVKVLEAFFGRMLFDRRNNRISLTDAGHTVLRGCGEPFSRLAGITATLRDSAVRSRTVISVLGSVAERWLVPRMARYLERHPGTRIELRIDEDPIDLAGEGIDLRLCYGSDRYPGNELCVLFTDVVTPMCSPDFLARRLEPVPGPGALTDDMLIHTNWGRAFSAPPGWREWYRAAARDDVPDTRRGHRAGSTGLAMDLAAQGVGMALGQKMLAASDLRDRRLIAPFDLTLPLEKPYCLVFPKEKTVSPETAGIRDWLLSDV